MGCSRSGSSGGISPWNGAASGIRSGGGRGGGGGQGLEPFPRQTLVGNPGGPTTYCSPTYDSTDWMAVAWWFECYGSLPGLPGTPLTMYIETSEVLDGPWIQLVTQTANGGEQYDGVMVIPGSLVRVRIVIQASEISSVAVRFVARGR